MSPGRARVPGNHRAPMVSALIGETNKPLCGLVISHSQDQCGTLSIVITLELIPTLKPLVLRVKFLSCNTSLFSVWD